MDYGGAVFNFNIYLRMEEETNKEEPEKTPGPEKAPEPDKLPESEKAPEPEKEPEMEKEPESEKASGPGNASGSGEAAEGGPHEERYEVPPISDEDTYSKTFPRRRLYKSRKNRILFGVCGGLGEYLNIDPVIIRLIFVLSFLIGGWGFLVYILAAVIMPGSPEAPLENEKASVVSAENSKMILGSALILLGLYALLRTTGMLRYFSFFGITHEFIIPLILIILGVMLVVKQKDFFYRESPSGRRLYRSASNRMIAGVCAGLGNYLNIDPTLVRIIWVILTFGSFGIGILIYVLFALLVPLDNEVNLEK